MIQCPKCSAKNLPESRFCSSCGQELSSLSQMPTMESPESEVPPSPVDAPHVGRIVSSDSVPAGGFTPGTILANRYRIIGLLGRGGMGEVYRADDLKLGQPVALKFLPPKLADDPVRRERFFAEVRITRQLSHPNICRVYDIGEVDGRHFLSMEYIDGEDLASLMKRIGHLSNEKALDIARQLMAGLSVAHERGVLHRDLKPANIMLDGHGRVRITDFGLAIAAEDEVQTEEIAGTPAYMAPEQLAGKGATVRSDIYSLGLILYEIYTGKKAFKAKTLAELREQKETQTPRAPSELREGIDPVVERVIQRCMEKDPSSRPASVAQLAQSLPGGDPLAAAIAAGETPSPEMVAASGGKEGLRPAVAWSILVFIILGTLGILWVKDRYSLLQQISFEKPPEYLVERAREVIEKAGYSVEFTDNIHGFQLNEDLIRYVESLDKSDRKKLYSKTVLFMYLQSPTRLQVEWDLLRGSTSSLRRPGDVMVLLDTEGRLVSLRAIPLQEVSSPAADKPIDWGTFFDEAGLDFDSSQWDESDTQWKPLYYANSITSWQNKPTEQSGEPDKVNAAEFYGKPICFEITYPWDETQEETSELPEYLYERIVLTLLTIVLGLVLCYFARRNMRLGRGDRHNANRLALTVMVLWILLWVFTGSFRSYELLIWAPLVGGIFWIFYMAVEPYFRRRWPQILVSWTRLFSKEWKDPLVGRDIFIGCGLGVLAGLFQILAYVYYNQAFNVSAILAMLTSISGFHLFVYVLLLMLLISLIYSFFWGSLLLVSRFILRSDKAAFSAVVLIWALLAAVGERNLFLTAIFALLVGLSILVLMRFGLLAVGVGIFIITFFSSLPILFKVSAFYTKYCYTALAIFAAIVLYAFYYSLGGRPIFGTPRLDD
jgi:serine/threonine protein kinase